MQSLKLPNWGPNDYLLQHCKLLKMFNVIVTMSQSGEETAHSCMDAVHNSSSLITSLKRVKEMVLRSLDAVQCPQ